MRKRFFNFKSSILGSWAVSVRVPDLNHRPLGYECHHQQNLKTMRGAKSNALFSSRTDCNRACLCLALVIGSLALTSL